MAAVRPPLLLAARHRLQGIDCPSVHSIGMVTARKMRDGSLRGELDSESVEGKRQGASLRLDEVSFSGGDERALAADPGDASETSSLCGGEEPFG